jgi:colicin import membrane protein
MQMKTASAISVGLHVAVLVWATLSFAGKSFEAPAPDPLPVDLISDKQFSELTKGMKDAPKPLEKPKPVVEKKAEEVKPIEELKPKVSEKKEIAPTQEKAPPPQPQPKPDPIAEKLKSEPDQKQLKSEPTPLPPHKPPRPQPKFDSSKIAALINQRDPERKAALGADLNASPSLGAPTGSALTLSQSELDALRARLMGLWNPPVGMQDAERLQITIRIAFTRNGTLASPPIVVTSGNGVRFNAMRDSAVRAVLVGQPYTMLRPDHYESWKEIDFTFDSSQMYKDIPAR